MSVIRIAFVGAGQVNFGGGEGPWNHAARLDRICSEGTKIEVVGVADVADAARVQWVIDNQRKVTQCPSMWSNVKIFQNFVEMLDTTKPHAVFIGVPPENHGSTKEGHDVEVQCARRGIHMFIEKPLSCWPLDEVQKVADILEEAATKGVIVSVGYMFRYSKAVMKMKEVMKEHGKPKAFNARYDCAYSTIKKDMWWDVRKCGGPIVEQATHFCDLARFLVDDANLNTVQAISIKQTDGEAGKLNYLPPNIKEDAIDAVFRIPRVTSAFWKFNNGAIGNLMHGALLHEIKYETELEVWGDGYRIVLIDPYAKCRVAVRLPSSEAETIYDFSSDDYYYNEDTIFLHAVDCKLNGKDASQWKIESPYSDAFKTYQLTWKIKSQSERE
eukprot:TRINITY_DN5852_c0_g1_i2.p1 TRINITY_DN5852_c0_g1~~TRINITY_DN5852_c0_g1_i2.p1  ORF type:complete len:385 (-),score=87.84 TRINITY_DN5852_c0_g1_i2:38-1192(-)